MATGRFFLEEKMDSSTQSIPWQQIYFEVPFYFFLIVPMSLLFSWKLAYQNIVNFVEGRKDNDKDFSLNRDRIESAESLDNVISASVINDPLRINEPLLPRRKSTKVTITDTDLKKQFKMLVWVIVFSCLSNTFMVLFPVFVKSDEEGTTVFSIG